SADASIGEDHRPETHLVPLVIQAAMGQREQLTIFGTDYPTPDGTCIRDYVHVEDLVEAHVLVMNALRPGDARVYNLGIGRGYSVLEILETTEGVVGRPVPRVLGARRPGDPARLFAEPKRIRDELGWSASRSELRNVIESAYRWHERRPAGYA
ncbi:MAG TPA: NAD-dependent epimerase/dehydratase family protein, partial [Polyangiaceae bacterium]|nr:NAD-dependent epimerase/dehydratase family protein [Polyangiaceae bacterium]